MSEDCGSSNSITLLVFVLVGISNTVIVDVITIIVVGTSVAIIVLGDGGRFILKV